MIPTSHCPTRRSSDLGLTTIWPFSTTARSLVACTPRIADCGGLVIGVDSIEPNTPPLEIENGPLVRSSIARLVDCARVPQSARVFSLLALVIRDESRI